MSRCSKYHVLISCLVDGEVTLEERCKLEEHFRKCDACLVRYNKYKQISTAVESIYTNQPLPLSIRAERASVKGTPTFFFDYYRYLALPGFAAFLLVVLSILLFKSAPSVNSPLMVESSTSIIHIPLSTFSYFDSTVAESNQSRLSYLDNAYEKEETGSSTLPVYESPLFSDKLTENVNFYQSSSLFLE